MRRKQGKFKTEALLASDHLKRSSKFLHKLFGKLLGRRRGGGRRSAGCQCRSGARAARFASSKVFYLKKWRNYGSFRVFSEGKSNLYWYGCNSTSDGETCGQTKGCACHSVRSSKNFFFKLIQLIKKVFGKLLQRPFGPERGEGEGERLRLVRREDGGGRQELGE